MALWRVKRLQDRVSGKVRLLDRAPRKETRYLLYVVLWWFFVCLSVLESI